MKIFKYYQRHDEGQIYNTVDGYEESWIGLFKKYESNKPNGYRLIIQVPFMLKEHQFLNPNTWIEYVGLCRFKSMFMLRRIRGNGKWCLSYIGRWCPLEDGIPLRPYNEDDVAQNLKSYGSTK